MKTELDDIRVQHSKMIYPDEPFVWVTTGQWGLRKVVDTCSSCERDWPCGVAQVLAAFDAAEADADRLAEALDLLGEHDFGCPAEPCGCELEAALDDHAKRKEERA